MNQKYFLISICVRRIVVNTIKINDIGVNTMTEVLNYFSFFGQYDYLLHLVNGFYSISMYQKIVFILLNKHANICVQIHQKSF